MVSLRKLTRWAGLGLAVLCCALSALVAGHLFGRQATNQTGLDNYASGYWATAANYFAQNKPLNFFQPWLTPFNAGSAHAQDRNWVAAEAELRAALQARPGQARCMISLNLAWTLEARGDEEAAGGNEASARVSWRAALLVLDESGCATNPAPQPGQESETRERLAEKLGESSDQPPPSSQPPSTPASSSQPPSTTQPPAGGDASADRASQLEERNRSAASEARAQQESRSLPPQVDSPW